MKRQDDKLQEALTRLAAGELRGFAAARLRRRIAKDAALRREWEATEALWDSLKTLQNAPAPNRPAWSTTSTTAARSGSTTPIWIIGGIAMNRRIALAACAGLTLFTVTAGYAAHKWLYDPFTDTRDTYGHIWHVDGHFRGEVKQYDLSGTYLGSFGSNNDTRPDVTADVTLDNRHYLLLKAGRHELRDAKGALVGYADLVPETQSQREVSREKYLRRENIDEILPVTHGDTDGVDASGFFGDDRQFTFRLTGNSEARFTRTDNGHVIMHALATGAENASVAAPPPTFTWSENGKSHSVRGIGRKVQLTLPGDIPVQVDILAGKPENQSWTATGNFRGQVKMYNVNNEETGSSGTDDDSGYNSTGSVTADVTIGGWHSILRGAGRHEVRDKSGALVGYANLVPETKAQRAEIYRNYLRQNGLDEALPISHSVSGSTNLDSEARGSFGNHQELTFQLTGVGQVRFTRTDGSHKGHVVARAYTGKAGAEATDHPVLFTWTANGISGTIRGLGAHTDLTLPGGIPVRVDLIPVGAK